MLRLVRRCALLTILLIVAGASTALARIPDYSGGAYMILAPGEYGAVPPTSNSTDQGMLYDGLTPLRGNVTQADLSTYYLSEKFGVNGTVVRTEHPKPGVTIFRDRWDIPHIYGKTRGDVMFGSGYVAAEDRGLLLQFGLGPAYAATLDIPGLNAFSLVTSARSFTPSKETIRFVAKQANVLRHLGRKGRQVIRDLKAWAAGINAYEKSTGGKLHATLTDAIAGFAFIGSIFGTGGGNEVANSNFLAGLEQKFGRKEGLKVFRDLREVNDPEAPTTTRKRFDYDGVPKGRTPGAVVIDPGSESSTALAAAAALRAQRQKASNFLVAGAGLAANHHPMAVMGPQLGYYYPEIVMQAELHGGGIDAMGVIAPIAPYVFIGRGRDFAWSLTSAESENEQQFLLKLCNPNHSSPTRASTHYFYKGKCRAMHLFDAGLLGAGGGKPAQELKFWDSRYGPISGTVTVHGRPYAIALDRTTRGREPAGELAFSDLDSNRVHNPEQFFHAANELGTTFNMPYVDSRHTAYFSTGLLPVLARGTDPSLPTLGTGRYDWRGFLTLKQHPHAIGSRDGTFLNWNNKPAPGWGAASNNWNYGPIHRVQMYTGFHKGMTEADDVSIMNRAATTDLRGELIWPTIDKVLSGGPAPSTLAQQAVNLVNTWVAHGASDLGDNATGKIDDPGEAVMNASWNGLAEAVLAPVLGSALLNQLATIIGPDGYPSFGSGWYGYVYKDLRTGLGMPVKGRYSREYCGNGSLAACRASLWAAIQAAANQLAATQGSNPNNWRSPAQRITFSPGLISYTMRWTDRSTFQQVIQFTGHGRSR